MYKKLMNLWSFSDDEDDEKTRSAYAHDTSIVPMVKVMGNNFLISKDFLFSKNVFIQELNKTLLQSDIKTNIWENSSVIKYLESIHQVFLNMITDINYNFDKLIQMKQILETPFYINLEIEWFKRSLESNLHYLFNNLKESEIGLLFTHLFNQMIINHTMHNEYKQIINNILNIWFIRVQFSRVQ